MIRLSILAVVACILATGTAFARNGHDGNVWRGHGHGNRGDNFGGEYNFFLREREARQPVQCGPYPDRYANCYNRVR